MTSPTPRLEIGFYIPTEKFKAIPEHIAICGPGGALIAVVGPSGDPLSKETAESFIVAVNAYDAHQKTISDLQTLLGAERDRFGKLETELLVRIQKLREALDKIYNAGNTLRVNEVPYPLRVTVENLKEIAKKALSETPSVPSADRGGEE